MKFFKKTINLLLVLLLSIFIVGCKPKEGEENNDPIPLDTRYTDELELDQSPIGKDFIEDGIGIVELNRCVDGDTISVYTGNRNITIRFLGIDTPESTGVVEAWGKTASEFVKQKLENAVSIVLEAEGERIDSTGNRYLAWVWYKTNENDKYRLLNLEEIELAYSVYMVDKSYKNHEILWAASEKARQSEKRIYGEKDPNFNYSKEVIETSILYILNNHEDFQTGTKFLITVKLVRTVGNNMFLEDAYEVSYDQDGEITNGKGYIYAFYGYSDPYYRKYKIGDIFTLQCQLEYEGMYGTQLTGLRNPSKVIENVSPEILSLDANDLNGGSDLEPYYGRVVQVNNLKCHKIEKRTSNNDEYYVVEFVNEDGDLFDVYFSNHLIIKHQVEKIFTVGKIYNITGGIAYYEYANGQYQISVGDAPRYSKGELEPDDLPRVNDIIEVE